MIGSLLDLMVADLVTRETQMIERACERMLTDPTGYGVLVERFSDRVEVSLSPEVPFGHLHDHHHAVTVPSIHPS